MIAPACRLVRSLPDREVAARERFLERYPEYVETFPLGELRAREFERLERTGSVYLDYTGGGLYAASQVTLHAGLLQDSVLGNPHSGSPASALSTWHVEETRQRVLEFFRADPDEWVVVFTANASHALKLVGEAYPFVPGSRFLLTFDNHNSVNGIREYDRAQGADTRYVPMRSDSLRVTWEDLERELDAPAAGAPRLFAFPAQSNFSGVQHPLEWIGEAQERGWDVLLDAAAYVPTNRLDLSLWHPDYVALSFYKMFGYPTGVGALIARRRALEKLHRPWFAGGTITVASVQADSFVLAPGSEGFEDGTLNYAAVPAVKIGLDLLDRMGVETVHTRVRSLTGWLIEGLLSLRHANGRPLVRLYGPREQDARGATIAINFLTADGAVLDHAVVEEKASAEGISLRTGCFCNPGAGELALGLHRAELETCFGRADSCSSYEAFRTCLDPAGSGAVRISLGWVSNLADVERFLDFAAGLAV
ncbi:MAG: aminotransferase class V-fold PLP-dependent enzyme [Thermoanaerobaculia bacterium]